MLKLNNGVPYVISPSASDLNTSYVKVKLAVYDCAFGVTLNLNTSYVKVKLLCTNAIAFLNPNLNTSYVKVKRWQI